MSRKDQVVEKPAAQVTAEVGFDISRSTHSEFFPDVILSGAQQSEEIA